MEDRGMATKAAKWLFKQNLCNGSAVVSPFPVYQQSPDLSGTLGRRARRRIGIRGEEKVIGILGAENHEERRQIRAFLDQQYMKDYDTSTDFDDASSEFDVDRIESRASPLPSSSSSLPHSLRCRGPVRGGGGGGDRSGRTAPWLARTPPTFQDGVSNPSSSSGSSSRFRAALRTPPPSPTAAATEPSVYSPKPKLGNHLQHHLDRERAERDRVRGIYQRRRQEEQAKLHHLPPILWPRPAPLYHPNSNHQQQQQHMNRYVEYPGMNRNVNSFANYPSPRAPVFEEQDGIFAARVAQSPPRRSFTRPATPTFTLSEPQSPYLSPRMSPYPTYTSSPRPTVSISEKLGCGSYSVVYKGEYLGKQVAVKVLHDDERISAKEVSVLSPLDHQNIVKYHGTATLRDGRFCILLELMKCSLASLLKEYNGLDEGLIRDYTRQVLRGLEYLHRMNILHRDIKCGNILLDSTGKAKLADFGLAKKIDRSCAKSCKGTFAYMAPEVLLMEGDNYGLAADVWSLGCTVIEMACGKPPWSGLAMMPFYERIREGQFPPIPSRLSVEAVDFIKRCLTRDPRRRPGVAALLKHPFVAN